MTPNNLSLDLADWWNRNNHKKDTSSRGVTTFFAKSVHADRTKSQAPEFTWKDLSIPVYFVDFSVAIDTQLHLRTGYVTVADFYMTNLIYIPCVTA